MPRHEWQHIALILLFLFVVTFTVYGDVITSPGIPDIQDQQTYLIAGYDAQNDQYRSAWEDALFPGLPRHPTRSTLPYMAVGQLTDWFGNLERSVSLVAFAGKYLAFVAMFALAYYLTRSKLGAIAAALLFGLNQIGPFGNIAYSYGYALTPLVFLFLLKTLREGGYRSTLLYGAAVALVINSSILPYLLVFLIANGSFFLIYFLFSLRHQPLRTTLARSGLLLVGGAVGLLLSAQYLVIAFNSLANNVGTAGYSLELIAAYGTAVFSDAVLLEASRLKAVYSLAHLQIATVGVVALGIAAVIWRPRPATFAALGLVLIGIVITVGPNPPFQQFNSFLWTHVPSMDNFRPSTRPMTITVLGYAMLLAIATEAATSYFVRGIGAIRGQSLGALIRAAWSSKLAFTTLFVLLLVVGYYGVVHGLAREDRVFNKKPPIELVHAWEWIGADPDDSVFTGLPFLRRRVIVPWGTVEAADATLTYGTGISGKRALSRGAIGGLVPALRDIQPLANLSDSYKKLEFADETKPVSLSNGGSFEFLATKSRDFIIDMTVVATPSGPDPKFTLQLSYSEEKGAHIGLEFDYANELLKVYRIVDRANPRRIDYATQPLTAELGAPVRVNAVLNKSQIWVAIDGEPVINAPAPANVPAGGLRVTAKDLEAKIGPYRVSRLRNFVPLNLDKILALYQVKHVVVPQYARDGLFDVMAMQPNMTIGFQEGDTIVLENGLYREEKFFYPKHVTFVIGNVAETLSNIVNADDFNPLDVLLISTADLPKRILAINRGRLQDLVDSVLVVRNDISARDRRLVTRCLPVCAVRYLIPPNRIGLPEGTRLKYRRNGQYSTTAYFQQELLGEGRYQLAMLGMFDLDEVSATVNGVEAPSRVVEATRTDYSWPGGVGEINLQWLLVGPFDGEQGLNDFTVSGAGWLMSPGPIRKIVKPLLTLITSTEEAQASPPIDLFHSRGTAGTVDSFKNSPADYALIIRAQRPGFVVFLERFNPALQFSLYQERFNTGWQFLPNEKNSNTSVVTTVRAQIYAIALYIERPGVVTGTLRFTGQAKAKLGWYINLSMILFVGAAFVLGSGLVRVRSGGIWLSSAIFYNIGLFPVAERIIRPLTGRRGAALWGKGSEIVLGLIRRIRAAYFFSAGVRTTVTSRVKRILQRPGSWRGVILVGRTLNPMVTMRLGSVVIFLAAAGLAAATVVSFGAGWLNLASMQFQVVFYLLVIGLAVALIDRFFSRTPTDDNEEQKLRARGVGMQTRRPDFFIPD